LCCNSIYLFIFAKLSKRTFRASAPFILGYILYDCINILLSWAEHLITSKFACLCRTLHHLINNWVYVTKLLIYSEYLKCINWTYLLLIIYKLYCDNCDVIAFCFRDAKNTSKEWLLMSLNKLRKKPYIKHICAVHVYEI